MNRGPIRSRFVILYDESKSHLESEKRSWGFREGTIEPVGVAGDAVGVVPGGDQGEFRRSVPPIVGSEFGGNFDLKLGVESCRVLPVAQGRVKDAADLDEMMDMFPILRERAHQAAGTLSGGEQEMLAIARALMARPELLIFDEPSLGLAPKIVAEVGETIARIKAMGKTILLVEQNSAMALRLADRAYLFEAGEIVLSGTGEELQSHPEVAKAYLGH